MDPWWEIVSQTKTRMDTITDIGVVIAGHPSGIERWADFLETFTVPDSDPPVIRGWTIIEPESGQYSTAGETLGMSPVVTDTLNFVVRGFTARGDDPEASQEAFRELAWLVKKELDSVVSYDLSDASIDYNQSYPASGGGVTPMLFGQVECWGAEFTKQVEVTRTATLQEL